MQKPVTIGDKEFLFVEAPVDATDCTIGGLTGDLYYSVKGRRRHIEMPSDGWHTIIGKGNEITEEQARGIVEYEFQEADDLQSYYSIKNYETDDWDCDCFVQSLHSKIRAENMLPETTIVLLKNK